MNPTLIEGDFVLVKKLTNTIITKRNNKKDDSELNLVNISKNDICIFYHPNSTLKCVKRCSGIINDTVDYYDDPNAEYYFSQLVLASKSSTIRSITMPKKKRVVVPENEFFFIGDNIDMSCDSRYFGLVESKDIIGKTGLILFNYRNKRFHWDRFLKKIE